MKKKKNYFMLFGIISTIAAILQIYGIIRYVKKIPQDTTGIIIYSIAALAFIIMAFGNFIRWSQSKKNN